MKKAFVAILSLAALVGCSRDVIVDTPASAIIQFGDSFVENKTRAEITTSDPSDDVKDFTVWGYRGSNDVENLADLQLVFNRQNVYRNFDENTWEYSPLQYWLPGESYFFAAVSPALRDAEGNERTDIIVTENLLEDGLGTIEFTNTDGSVDLLYDQLTVPAANIEEKVELQFAHLLAKIKFSFSHNFPNSLTTVGIKNIHYVNSPKTGTIDVTEPRTNWAWSIPQNADNTVSLDFGGVEKGANFVANTYKSSDKECLVIPSTRTHHVEFDVVIYHNGVEAHTYEKVTSQFEYTFVQGKAYDLKADITPAKLDMDAIEFTVVVEDWVPDGQDVDFPEEDGDDNTGDNGDEKTYNLYFNNLAKWEAVYAHIWANEGEDLGLEASEWPGRKLEETETIDGVTYHVFKLPAAATGKTVNVVFNDGNGQQTKDLSGVATENLFFDNYVEPTPEPEPTAAKLYLNTGKDWYEDNNGDVWFAAYFFGAGETWTKLTAVEGEEYLFETSIPDGGYTKVIFVQMYGNKTGLDWGSKKNQTIDIDLLSDGSNCYTIENPWDRDMEWKAHGSWGTYTPTVEEPENPEPEPEEPAVVYTTVAEFLAAEEDESENAPMYTLKGTITAVANTTYGNFDLTDDTGTVYIYGLNSPDGATKQYWADSGAKLGDDIVVKTVRTSFNGTAQGKYAWFVGLTSPGTRAFWSFSKTAVTFAAAGGQEVITVEAYNTTENITVVSDNEQFTATYADGKLTITANENATAEAINGNITVTAGALKQVITVAQGGASVGGGTEVVVEKTMASFGWANAAGVSEAKLDENVTVKFAQGNAGTAPAYYTSGSAVRLYQSGAQMTVTANGKTIKSIEIQFANNHYYIAPNVGEFSEEGATRIWTGEATEILFTTTGTDKNHRAYISAIKVTYVD